MNAEPLRTHDYLERMLEAVERVEAYTTGFEWDDFRTDARTQDAVIRNLEVIGEAAKNALQHDPAFVTADPDLPWSQAYRMRNALSYGYANVDTETVWRTARTSLPPLKNQLVALLQPD